MALDRSAKLAGPHGTPVPRSSTGIHHDRRQPGGGLYPNEESAARRLLEDASLTIENVSLGRWPQNPGWTYQDAFLLSAEHSNSVRNQS